MRTLSNILFCIVASLVAVFIADRLVSGSKKITFQHIENSVHKIEANIPDALENLKTVRPTKSFPNSKTIVLEEANSVTIAGPITANSMADAMTEIDSKLDKLSKDATLYLVMDTGGGSVFAGLGFIDYVKSLPNNVVTVTKFAASMGFQIVQNMGTRYITTSGTLMSHRARGGVQGQFDGELESQYRWIKENIDRLDLIAADRMEISYEEYKKLIVNEFWSNGFRSVNNKSADEVVNARCGKSLRGIRNKTVTTLFGAFDIKVSKCPLIRGVLGTTNTNKISLDIINKFKLGYEDPRKFTEKFILTNEYLKFIK